MAVQTFGVTAATIADEIGFLTLDANSEPPSTKVTIWIAGYAAELATVMWQAQSVDARDVSTATDEDLYTLCALKISAIVVARWLAANERDNTELYIAASEDWGAFLGRVRGGQIGMTGTARVRSHINPALSTDGPKTIWRKGMDL